MHEAGLSEHEMLQQLHWLTRNVGRNVSLREIKTQITGAAKVNQRQNSNRTSATSFIAALNSAPSWPDPEYGRVYHMARDGISLYDLWQASPVRFDDRESQTEEIIDILFPGDPLLCVGEFMWRFATRRRSIWRGCLSRLPLITPNPMLSVSGVTEEGKKSEHAKSATAARVYLCIEFDFSVYARDGKTESPWALIVKAWQEHAITVADACAALHWHLAQFLPLVLVVSSGGKSLHGWYLVFGRPESELKAFMRYAVTLGADRATWCRSQFVRLPDGLRENGQRQFAYFFNPQNGVENEEPCICQAG
jgi:hypothetical protein